MEVVMFIGPHIQHSDVRECLGCLGSKKRYRWGIKGDFFNITDNVSNILPAFHTERYCQILVRYDSFMLWLFNQLLQLGSLIADYIWFCFSGAIYVSPAGRGGLCSVLGSWMSPSDQTTAKEPHPVPALWHGEGSHIWFNYITCLKLLLVRLWFCEWDRIVAQ